MARLDDLGITFDVADTRHRFNFLLMGEYDRGMAATLAGYLDAAPVRGVADSAVSWVLGRLWREKTSS